MESVDYPIWLWTAFTVGIVIILAFDLWVIQKEAHAPSFREAALWSAFWIVLALAFGGYIFLHYGTHKGLEYITGYLIEKSLSIDNVFVWMVVFQYFAVPPRYQHRVLFYGVLGAIVMRALFIAAGVTLINLFHWIVFVFGAILIFTGIRLAVRHGEEVHPERNPVVRLARRFLPMTAEYHGQRFFVRRGHMLLATPMLLVLLVVESTDVVFAIDSIPAILAITRDGFIVWTSNVMAILGLRALYFLVVGVLGLFRYLNYGLAAVLVFVGVKMLISEFYKIHVGISLGVVATIIGIAILASVIAERREARRLAAAGRPADPPGEGASAAH